MPAVNSNASASTAHTFIGLDVHKNAITAAVLPAGGGAFELVQLEHSEKAVRRCVKRLSDPQGTAICYEAGPCGYQLYRLLSRLGVACDIVAPSLTPVRPGDRVKTDCRDATKLAHLYRAGELTFVSPPTPEQEGLRDLIRCRDDLRCTRMAARHRISKQLLRYGLVCREGKKAGRSATTRGCAASVSTMRWPKRPSSICSATSIRSTRR
jgi:transposase